MSNIREQPRKKLDDDRTLGTGTIVSQNTNGTGTIMTARDGTEHYLEPQVKNIIPTNLNVLHTVGALLQTAEAIFLFAYSENVNLKWLLYTNYPVAVDNTLASTIGGEGTDNVYFARPESKFLSSFSITWVTGVIIALSAFDHIFAIMPKSREYYENDLARSWSAYRWLEYSISCSLMHMAIAQLVGVTDVHMIVLIFVLSISIQYPAYIHEVVNARARADGYAQYWSPFIFGCIPFVAVWGVIFSYCNESIVSGNAPPSFVLPTVIAIFILEALFPILFVLQWLKIGVFENYVMGEYGFMILGVIAKSSLAWITLIGSEKYAASFEFEETGIDGFFN